MEPRPFCSVPRPQLIALYARAVVLARATGTNSALLVCRLQSLIEQETREQADAEAWTPRRRAAA